MNADTPGNKGPMNGLGEAFGDFYGGAGYPGADEVAVELAEDDDADRGLDPRYAENRGRHALGTGLELAGGDHERSAAP